MAASNGIPHGVLNPRTAGPGLRGELMLNIFDLLFGAFLALVSLVLLLRWYYGEWPW